MTTMPKTTSNIIFICWGNICRSPMAEYIFKTMSNTNIISRGLSNEEYGNDIYPPAKKVLNEHKIPFNKHFAKKITQEEYNNADYIIVMESYQIDYLYDNYGKKDNIFTLLPKDIEDPWYTGNFNKVYNEIYEGCLKLKERI